MPDAQSLGTAVVGLGIIATTVWNGWQTVQGKRASHRAAENSRPVSNGFAADVLTRLETMQSSVTGVGEKLDRHLEAHANAQLAPVAPVVQVVGRQ